ncbi:MAG: LamG domain-containing protein [Bacteroidota bacterium]
MQKRISFPDNWVNLEAADNHANWVEGGGLEIVNSMILRSVVPATALNQACKASHEITIEAWIRPADLAQGNDDPARIVSLAESTSNRNATLGYERSGSASNATYEVSYRLENNGLEYKKTTFQANAAVEDRLHVVYVHESSGISRMYLNGIQITQRTDAGDFSNWVEDFPLVLGNEIVGGDVPWRGTYFLLALYDRALQPDEIQSHFESGTVKGRTLDNAFKWYAPGMHLLDSGLIASRDTMTEGLRGFSRHAAATLLPAALNTTSGANPTPVSFAVSPYLGLGLKQAVDPYTPLLVSAELLCLDQATGTLQPVASHFLNAGNTEEESIKWGEETHRKLCPDSPFAILRLREINERGDGSDIDTTRNKATLTATYGYAILKELEQPEKFARRVFPLRASVTDLRFREGQFGGQTMPVRVSTPVDEPPQLNVFEYAPPQAVGIQPLYIPGLWRIVDVDPDKNTKKHFVVIAQKGALSLYGPSPESEDAELVHLIAQLTDTAAVKRLKASLERGDDTLNEELRTAFTITSDADPETKPALSTAAVVHRAWPWGLSGLRIQVAYGAAPSPENPALLVPDYIGATGLLNESEDTERTLWWQSQPYQVQYRAARTGRPVAGLPKHFRAEAIKGFLPVLPTPPMPAINVSDETTFNAEASLAERWQAVLPGLMRYMVVGNRPGVPFAFRNQLIRQNGFEAGNNTRGEIMVSGSVPVQHRMPRPVSLPHTGRRERALQTWASYFEPNHLLAAETVPTDEAFFANCDGFDALRFKLKLINPGPGTLSADWNNDLVFSILIEVEGGNPDAFIPQEEQSDEPEQDPDTVVVDFIKDHIEEWVSIEIANGDASFSYELIGKEEGNAYLFRLIEKDKTSFEGSFGGLAPGGVLTAIARLGHPAYTDDYYQTMPFPMHRIDESKFRLPLRPYYVQFEDPEYNRRLSSAATQGTRNMKINVTKPDGEIENERSTVTFATDRKAYNPDSLLSLRFDWGQNFVSKGFLKVEKIEAGGGNPILLYLTDQDSGAKNAEFELAAGKLKQIQLNALAQETTPAALTTGITLQLTLRVTEIQETDVSLFEEQVVVLNVDIVEEAIIPKPEAAYGLLRAIDESASAVECARFAWGPEANRIDLVCPDDLRTGIVRRRAVFNWTDTVRPNPFKGYALQKITQTGATHFPTTDDFELRDSA